MASITPAFYESALRQGVLIAHWSPDRECAEDLALAAVIEFANLGFITDVNDLRSIPLDELEALLAAARKVVGADRAMEPVYPGFPEQVEAISTMQLIAEQILHYWTAGAFIPNYPTVAREGLPLADMLRNARQLEVLTPGIVADRMISEFLENPVAISEDDRQLLRELMELRFGGLRHPQRQLKDTLQFAAMLKRATNGENMQQLVLSYLAAVEPMVDAPVAVRKALFQHGSANISRVDHLLRFFLALYSAPAAAKWKENYELAAFNLADRHARAVRYERVPRPVRRALMGRLGELSRGFYADQLLSRVNLWRGVLRSIHAFDLKLSADARRAADIIAGNIEHRTVNSLVEAAMENGRSGEAAALLAEHQPGNLLRRIVALLRLTKTTKDATEVVSAVERVGAKSALTTLISAYNGVLSANDEHARVTRVAGLNNSVLDRSDVVKIIPEFQAMALGALDNAMIELLKSKEAPTGPVAVRSTVPVPLVRRDAATADRVLDRGAELALLGEGDTLRIFGHWRNNQQTSGYMDIGAVVLDGNFQKLAVTTWNSWSEARDWSTYSGDMLVNPGGEAAEFIDLKLSELRKLFPGARWVAMSVQSYSGFPINDVDFIAGAMLRSSAQAGEVFDARSVATAFKPTTKSLQSVPFAVDLEKNSILWVDSSNGSMQQGLSSTEDESIGTIVYDELARPRLSFGDLAQLWAYAHGVEILEEPVDRDEILALL